MTQTQGPRRNKRFRIILVLATIALASTGTVVMGFSLHLFGPSSCSKIGNPGPNSVHFTLIMSNLGFNESKIHSEAWPVLNVTNGQSVTIHVENHDTVEPHGLAITHYLDDGVTVRPGQCDDVSFTASQIGTFKVFCNIFCSIHQFMLNGQLNVNP